MMKNEIYVEELGFFVLVTSRYSGSQNCKKILSTSSCSLAGDVEYDVAS